MHPEICLNMCNRDDLTEYYLFLGNGWAHEVAVSQTLSQRRYYLPFLNNNYSVFCSNMLLKLSVLWTENNLKAKE